MKKSVFGRKLKRDKNERKALFKSLMSALILEDRIQTSQAKAKAIKPEIERLVTKALKGGNASVKIISGSIHPEAVKKLINDIAPRFKDRKGGYTRIINLGKRLGDQSPVVVLEWVEMAKAVTALEPQKLKVIHSTSSGQKSKETVVKKVAPKRKVGVKKTAVKKAKGKTK